MWANSLSTSTAQDEIQVSSILAFDISSYDFSERESYSREEVEEIRKEVYLSSVSHIILYFY